MAESRFVDYYILIVLALSTHSVLEGLAVGLGLTNSDVWTLTIGRKTQPVIYQSGLGNTLCRPEDFLNIKMEGINLFLATIWPFGF